MSKKINNELRPSSEESHLMLPVLDDEVLLENLLKQVELRLHAAVYCLVKTMDCGGS